MTVEVISPRNVELPFNYQDRYLDLKPLLASRKLICLKKSSRPTFERPKLPVVKPTRVSKHVLKIDIKGKRHPSVFKRTIKMRVSTKQLIQVFIKQAEQEEKSCLKMLGLGFFFLELSKKKHKSKCPFCSCRCKNSDNLKEKIEKDALQLISHVPESAPLKKRNEQLALLRAQTKCIPQRLTMSDRVSKILLNERDIKVVFPEFKLGARDALRLLKVTLLKEKKCGICDSNIENHGEVSISSVLRKIDNQLSELN